MRKQFKLVYLAMIPFILSGCFKDKEAGYMKNFANGSGFKNLADAPVLFSNSKITGWDRSGPLYFVADCNNIDDDIKFVNTTSKDRTFIDGKNEDFERSVDNFINEKFNDVYSTFEEQYKINWDSPYKYYCDSEDYSGDKWIYFNDTELLFVVAYVMNYKW